MATVVLETWGDSYWKAVRAIAQKALAEFGVQVLRTWSAGNDNPKVTGFVREQVQYSSWTVSDNHVVHVVQHTKHLPLNGNVNKTLAVQRVVAVRAMQDDVRDDAGKLCAANMPVMYKLRAMPANRFLVRGDYDIWPDDSDMTEIKKDTRPEIVGELEAYASQFRQLGLPVPRVDIVAFNNSGEEIPE